MKNIITVIPAKAGISLSAKQAAKEIPACAGMTDVGIK